MTNVIVVTKSVCVEVTLADVDADDLIAEINRRDAMPENDLSDYDSQELRDALIQRGDTADHYALMLAIYHELARGDDASALARIRVLVQDHTGRVLP